MNRFKKLTASLMTTVLFAALTLTFNACSEQSPLEPSNGSLNQTLAKGKKGGSGGNYPQVGAVTLSYVSGSKELSIEPRFAGGQAGYTGGTINAPQGSKLQISPNSLTAPERLQGSDVTITMEVKKKKKQGEYQLEFTFGPHGSTFSPPAEVTFDWTDLGIDVANLYYIDENGNYVQQSPDNIDIQNKRMTIYVDHFSRYAIGME